MALNSDAAMGGALGGAAKGAAAGAMLGPWGAVAGGVIGGVMGLFGGGAEDDAIQAQRQADLESARRSKYRNAMSLGEATAQASASGRAIGSGGSMSEYLSAMSSEYERENTMNVDAANRGAAIRETASLFSGFSGVIGSAFKFGEANNWFKEPTNTIPGGKTSVDAAGAMNPVGGTYPAGSGDYGLPAVGYLS